MGKTDGHRRVRFVGVLISLTALLLALVPPASVSVAASPAPDPAPNPYRTAHPAQPGNHAAQQEWYIEQRPGLSAKARFDALVQAGRLPGMNALPGTAIGGRKAGGNAASTPGSPTGTWNPLGPAPIDYNQGPANAEYNANLASGRVTAIAIGPNTGNIYIGTAGGGVWKSTDGGASWAALTDNQPVLAIGSLTIDPIDTTDNTVYAGTGEANFPAGHPDNSLVIYNGAGVLKTTNGGTSWTLQGYGTFGPYGRGIGAIAAHGQTVWAGTTSGLFQSGDGGNSWSQVTVASVPSTAMITDVTIDNAAPGSNGVYVTVSDLNGGTSYAGVYKSTAGSPFTLLTGSSPLPAATSWQRAQLAESASSPSTLYLIISSASTSGLLGLFKTTNGGGIWTQLAAPPTDPLGTQGQYDLFVTIDPTDANVVSIGGLNAFITATGGTAWTQLSDVYCSGGPLPCSSPLHPDMHAGAFGNSGTPRPLFVGSDGGMVKTANRGTSWININNNLNATTFYGGDAAANYMTTPVVIGGLQDNGNVRTASTSLGTWAEIYGGDGFQAGVDKSNANHAYVERYSGFLASTTNANAGTAITWTTLGGGGTNVCYGNGMFNNPFAIDINNGNHIASVDEFGRVCESIDGGTTWTSPTVSTGSFPFIRSVAIAPSNSAVMYAGSRGGIFRTTNANTSSAASWSACGSGLPSGARPVSIWIDSADSTIAYVTFSDFGVPHVWKSVNCGAWQSLSGDLPNIPTISIVEYPSSPSNVLVVGTDVGVYVASENGASTSWSRLTGLPNVGVEQLFMDKAQTTLFAATYGRGMWEIPIPALPSTITSLSPIAVPVGNPTFTLTVNGTGFVSGAQVLFNGSTRTTNFVNVTQLTATINAGDVAARGTAQITVRNPDNSVSAPWTFFIFTPLANPAAAAATLGPLFAFVRGVDNNIYLDPSSNGLNYAGYQSVGPGASTTPSAATIGSRMFLAVRGLDNNLYLNTTYDGYHYLGWASVGAGTCGAPALTALGNVLYIFACGLDNNLYFNTTTDGGTFGGWRSFGSGVVSSVPAVTTIGNTLYVAVRGLDNVIYINSTVDGMHFAGWRGAPTGAVPSAPALAGLGGALYLAVQGGDNAIYVNTSLDGGYTFRNWYGPGGAVTAAPGLGVVNNTLILLARGQDGATYANGTPNGYNFYGWHSLLAGGSPGGSGRQEPTNAAQAPSPQSGLVSTPNDVTTERPGSAVTGGTAPANGPSVAVTAEPPGGKVTGTALAPGATTAQPAAAPTTPAANNPTAITPVPAIPQPVAPSTGASTGTGATNTAPATGAGMTNVAFAPVAPFAAAADHRFFPETKHSVNFGFKAYWEANGGVALLGMPISEEFPERGADGVIRTVQYFERARMEYHPEFKGTPYETELGLLAREVTAGRAGEAAFLPVTAGATPTGARYYQETGHTLAAPFATFWDTNGGLAEFGFPISEPVKEKNADTGQTYLVQYFERYRLEYHPETGTIELGRLGVEVATERTYLPH